jgi:hypothetical protein
MFSPGTTMIARMADAVKRNRLMSGFAGGITFVNL